MDLDAFADLVAEAIDSLPEEFLERLENVQVDIEEWPTPDDLETAGLASSDRRSLLGLYHGFRDRAGRLLHGVPRPYHHLSEAHRGRCRTGCREDQGTGAAHSDP